MLVSHRHKFIFIKTRKTAGTSIEIAFSRFLDHPQDIITPIMPNDEEIRLNLNGRKPKNYRANNSDLWRPRVLLYLLRKRQFPARFWSHMPAVNAKRKLGKKIWDAYFKFSFVRNPWDNVVSHYYMDRSWKRISETTGFRDYVLNKVIPQCPKRLFAPVISGSDGLQVNFVGRMESLVPDLQAVSDRLGLNFDGNMPRAKGDLRKEKRHYSNYYDDETREAVGKMFEWEIKVFDYSFESAS